MKDAVTLNERLLKHAKDIISIDREAQGSENSQRQTQTVSISSLEEFGEKAVPQAKLTSPGKSKEVASNVVPLRPAAANKK